MRFQSNASFSALAPTSTSDPYGVAVTPYTTTAVAAAAASNPSLIPAPPAGNVNHIRWWMIEAGTSGVVPSPSQFIRIGTTTGVNLFGYVTLNPAIGFSIFSDVDIYISQGLTGMNGANTGSGANFTVVWRVEPIFS